MADVERDLSAGIELLEEVVQCVVGCGCWQVEGGEPPWDDPKRLAEALARRDAAWAAHVRAALERVAMLEDGEAAKWSIWLGQTLDACRAHPPQDPRVFFARARVFLATWDSPERT